jgi:UDP-GlcNAc:undecaprenyl-phosphate GlcNAc-1-phosphate transferase
MENYNLSIIAFFVTFAAILVLRPYSSSLNLVDKPSSRKSHIGEIPLIGGFCMFIGISVALFSSNIIGYHSDLYYFFISAFLLVFVGMLDDIFDISFSIRFIIQIIAALSIVIFGGSEIVDLGYLLFDEKLYLGPVSLIFTVFAVLGVINSLNFSDGIDGMASSLCVVTFFSIAIFAFNSENMYAFNFSLILIFANLAFLLFNLGIVFGVGKKIFMGDAGSTFLGLAIAWSLITFSQGEQLIFSPVTALWIYSIPLIDTISIMIRRISSGRSPFDADREHLHHLFLIYGKSQKRSLIYILLCSSTLAFGGILMDINNVNESLMFVSFLLISIIYHLIIKRAWNLIDLKN